MTPQFAASLTGFVGLCLLAGWVTGFRNRSYVGWLGLAFVALAGFLIAIGRARDLQEIGHASRGITALVLVLLVAWIGALLLSAFSAIQETARRLREIRQSHEAAAEGLLELMRASAEREAEAQAPPGDDEAPPTDDTT